MLEGDDKGRPKTEDMLLRGLVLLVWDFCERVLRSTSQGQLSIILPTGTGWFAFLFLPFILRMSFIRIPERSVPLVHILSSEV